MLLSYRIIIFIITIFLLLYFFNNDTNIITKIIIVLLLHAILYSDCYAEYFDNVLGTTHEELNNNRGLLGNFYVDCHKCGRERTLNDMTYNYKCNNLTEYTKKHNIEDSMSYHNNKYIDMKNQCYNCILKNTSLTRNYKDFPYVNGTPDTNSFTY